MNNTEIKSEMSDRPTPETDAASCSNEVEMLTSQSDPSAFYHRLCDAVAEIGKWKNDFDVMKRERDEAREDLEFRRGLYKAQEEHLETARRERDEALEDARLLAERLTRLELDSAFELAKLERERDKAREDATNFYAKIGELECERDEARREVDRYREEKDLSPMSWDT